MTDEQFYITQIKLLNAVLQIQEENVRRLENMVVAAMQQKQETQDKIAEMEGKLKKHESVT